MFYFDFPENMKKNYIVLSSNSYFFKRMDLHRMVPSKVGHSESRRKSTVFSAHNFDLRRTCLLANAEYLLHQFPIQNRKRE